MTESQQPRCRPHPSEPKFTCRMCRSESIADHTREPENLPTANFSNRPPVRTMRGRVERTENVVTVSFGGKS
jgi:hypothetical protein